MSARDPYRSLADGLRIERQKSGLYQATLESHGGERAFGGDVLARAALAAAAECDGVELHALHACFLQPAPGGRPVALHVESLADGRRLARRRVQVRDGERLLCDVIASFAAPGGSASWPGPTPPDDIPPPEALPSDVERARAEGWEENLGPVEMRRARPDFPFPPADPNAAVPWLGWVRPRTPLPDDPRAHLAALVYLSDLCSHWGVEVRQGAAFDWSRFASLDHALWLHGPARWDDWLRIETASDVAAAGRALTRRTLHARDGRTVATIAQEAIFGAA